MPDEMRPLAISPCVAECEWSTTGDRLHDEELFACTGCGSQWVVSEPWTPVDWQGLVPAAIRDLREKQPPA